MSAERAVYVDTSALVKLVVRERESVALRRYLGRQRLLVSSALVRAELPRALLGADADAARQSDDLLARLELVRVGDRVLRLAGTLLPPGLRTLNAIHLATAQLIGEGLRGVVTYDGRMADAAQGLGLVVRAPG
ncbi:MAG: type II toxin-antitoxin system VapC family toxin [Actinobacteria bacterium]|nr:type II toxin-antitoxin system VapC family toxin [Actinomycetota bacterium]